MKINPALVISTLALAVALALPAPASASLTSRFGVDADGMTTVPALSALASKAAGQPVEVRCYPSDPNAIEMGYTLVSADGSITPVVYLDGSLCGSLVAALHPSPAWLRDWWTTAQDAGQALLTLVHESTHIRLQSTDEALVECAAYRNAWPILAAIKLPSRMRARLWSGIRAAHENVASGYGAVC